MKKKNNLETVSEAESIAIVSDEEEAVGNKVHFWSKRPKEEGSHHHLERNELSSGAKKSMLTRIISAVVGLLIVVPAIFLGDWIYFAVISLALIIACYEVLGCTSKRTIVTVFVYFIFVAAIAYWPIFKSLVPSTEQAWNPEVLSIGFLYKQIYLPILVVAVGSFFVFFLTVIYKDFTVHDACYLITMAIIVGLGFQCLFYLRYFPNNYPSVPNLKDWTFTVDNTIKPSLLLVFVIFSTFMTDTGAYFVGVFFGKRKMNERISPKKTWEGFIGGIIISFLLSSTLALILSAIDWPIYEAYNPDTKEILISFALDKNWYLIFILSALIPLFATLGDFVFSSIKRYWGIKDYGKLIPGHGGVLDRLDSIIFAVIISSIFIHMLSSIGVDGFNWAGFLV